MNLPEFHALLSEFALAHPERELSSVTVVEFAEWQEEREVREHATIDLLAEAKCVECGVVLTSDYDKTFGLCSNACAEDYYGLPVSLEAK